MKFILLIIYFITSNFMSLTKKKYKDTYKSALFCNHCEWWKLTEYPLKTSTPCQIVARTKLSGCLNHAAILPPKSLCLLQSGAWRRSWSVTVKDSRFFCQILTKFSQDGLLFFYYPSGNIFFPSFLLHIQVTLI